MTESDITKELEAVKSLLATPELPELGPEARPGRDPLDILEQKMSLFFQQTKLPAAAHQPLRSAILLWHDYLDESHSISQGLHSRDGSFLHGIMHRREPDYSNAKYWFHRVGDHACFGAIASRVIELLKQEQHPALAKRLVPGGRWDAFAFIDACEEAVEGGPLESADGLLREIQRIEFEALLAHICGVCG